MPEFFELFWFQSGQADDHGVILYVVIPTGELRSHLGIESLAEQSIDFDRQIVHDHGIHLFNQQLTCILRVEVQPSYILIIDRPLDRFPYFETPMYIFVLNMIWMEPSC